LLGKRFRIEKTKEIIEAAKALGIKSYVHLMYNTPHETEEDIKRFISFVENHIRSDLVVFLPQRFLLEPQSLMYDRPGDYGLANLRKVEASPFEREELTFDESGGAGREAVAARNRRHRRLIAGHLEWIRFRNMLSGSPNPLVRLFPAGLLVLAEKHARRSKALHAVHTLLTNYLAGKAGPLREQL
jgi:hypothetical protein